MTFGLYCHGFGSMRCDEHEWWGEGSLRSLTPCTHIVPQTKQCFVGFIKSKINKRNGLPIYIFNIFILLFYFFSLCNYANLNLFCTGKIGHEIFDLVERWRNTSNLIVERCINVYISFYCAGPPVRELWGRALVVVVHQASRSKGL